MTTLNCVENVAAWLKTLFEKPDGTPKHLYEAQLTQGAKGATRIIKSEPVQPIFKGMEVHPFALPPMKEEDKKAPYIIVQFLNSTDIQSPENPVKTTVGIRFVIAVYNPNDDEQEGAKVLQELIDYLRFNLESKVLIPDVKQGADSYALDLTMGVSSEAYHEDTRPFSCGWMEMYFDLQSVIREDVQKYI